MTNLQAVIIATGIALGGFLAGGIYDTYGAAPLMFNKFTGEKVWSK